jgi:ABC-type Na+ transport system ATPase subunit NatA
VRQNRPVTLTEWVRHNTGVWWWKAEVPDGLTRALGGDARCKMTVMPAGAPLLGRVSSIDNCRAYANLFGVKRTSSEIMTCLRTLDVPDASADRPIEELTELHRTLTWLAMARLAATPVVVLVTPLEGASQSDRSQFRRVLEEATAFHSHIFLADPHQEAAVSFGARPVPTFLVTAP